MRLLAPVLACLVIGVPLARADDYPSPIIDRPLTLGQGTIQPSLAFELTHFGNVMDPAPSNTESLVFGADYGLANKLQVGAVAYVTISPSSEFGFAIASGQYQFLNFAAIRADIGVSRVDNGDHYGFFGAGLPLKLKMTDTVALISGRPYAYGAEDDIVIGLVGSGSISEFNIPIGILYQLTPHVSVAGRSGIHTEGSAYFVPIGADITLTSSRIDFGVQFDLAGQVSPSNGNGYADVLRLRAFAQLRI
jgi:hypothetical protein